MKPITDYSREELLHLTRRILDTESAMQAEFLRMFNNGTLLTTDEYCAMVVSRMLQNERQ